MALQGVKRLNLHLQIHPGGYPLGSNWIMAQPAEASSACRMRGAPHETWTLIPGSDATQLHWVLWLCYALFHDVSCIFSAQNGGISHPSYTELCDIVFVGRVSLASNSW